MSILTWDLETTIKKSMKRTANVFDEDNWVVMSGWQYDAGPKQHKYWSEKHNECVLPDLTGVDLIIGFNIKFDLLWAWKEPELMKFFQRGGRIYDGQYCEYLLSGMDQASQILSMNEVGSRYYEGGSKIDAVKEMWQNGVCTSDIPRDLLTDYLVGDGGEIMGDIENTYQIFRHQIARASKDMHPNFLRMLNHRMDGLLATTEMEYNGMHVHKVLAEELREDVITRLAEATETLEMYIPKLPKELTFNWNSNVHKSCLIFGGTVSYQKWTAHADDDGEPIYAKKTVQWPIFDGTAIDPTNIKQALHKVFGKIYILRHPKTQVLLKLQDVYLSGKRKNEPKFKNVDVPDTTKPKGKLMPYYVAFDGYAKPKKAWMGVLTDAYDNPTYSVGADIIEELSQRGIPFCDALSARTGLAKQLGTYFWTESDKGVRKGMLTLVGEDGIIHHKLNHVNTVTGRMSANDPNMQNIPRGDKSDIKKMFTSRFEGGYMAEIDYSQLEVVVQAVLSEDPKLTLDLQNGIDFHCKRLATKLGLEYDFVWDQCHVIKTVTYRAGRTKVKEFSFQRAYGAGAPAISKATGMSLNEVKDLIREEELAYPGVVEFDKKLEKIIAKSRVPTGRKLYVDGQQFSQGDGVWDCPTGTRFKWAEDITPTFLHEQGKFIGFSPTERKNYPPQGVGGEIVQTMLGKVFRFFVKNNMFDGDVLMVNTVHDCLQMDGKPERIREVTLLVQEVLESVPAVYNATFKNMNIVVPFPCESEVGFDLFTMEEIENEL